MKKIKITILKTDMDPELSAQYAIDDLGTCPWHQKGQALWCDGINPPEGMCGYAWGAIKEFAQLLAEEKLVQPSGTWLKDDTKAVVACPDGVRPVIMLLEAV